MIKSFSLTLAALFLCVLPVAAQKKDALPSPPQLWAGVELANWFRNVDDGVFIVPEVVFKHRFGRFGGLNLYTGYHAIKRDSLFGNIEYKNRGWFIKGGPELLLPVSAKEDVFYTLGGNIAYSRFAERAGLSFRYQQDAFEADINPDNVYRFIGRNRSDAWAFEFQQGLWFTDGPFSIQFLTRIGFLLRAPDNPFMPVHYMPGIGTRTPRYDLLFRNRTNQSKDTFVSLRIYLCYRLF